MRGIPEVPEGFGIRFPLDLGRALLEAAGLQADLVALLWGRWSAWGAPLLPAWLRTVCPVPGGGWASDLLQALRLDYALE
eukprot:9543800-Alexandrium_andersonii.AAC.1